MTTVKEVKQGAKLDKPIYKNDPYIILNRDNVVLWAGELSELTTDSALSTSYYNKCTIDIRTYDLYLRDNTKVNDNTNEVNITTAETWTIAKLFLMGFLTPRKLSASMSEINKAVKDIESILNRFTK